MNRSGGVRIFPALVSGLLLAILGACSQIPMMDGLSEDSFSIYPVEIHKEISPTNKVRQRGALSPDISQQPQRGINSHAPSLAPLTGADLPAYQSDSWVELGGPPGGLGYDIRVDFDHPQTMYVTSSPGGIFRSTDSGANWLAVNNGISSWSSTSLVWVFCATVSPHDPDVIWVGTQFNAQIYRSLDGGLNWEQRDNGIIPTVEEHSVRGITLDPEDPDIIYAALEEGIGIVNGIGRTKGEVYKTMDGGLNWERIWHGDNLGRYIWIDPSDTQRIYVSTGIFDRNAANSDPVGNGGGVGILRSLDGGGSWEELNESHGLGGLFIPSLFMHPTNSEVLLAAVTGGDFNFPAGNPSAPGVYKTEDGGDNWEMVYSGGVEAVEIATSNPDIWYAAGVNILVRSEDAGQTWLDFPMQTEDRKAGTPIDLQVDLSDPYRIFVNSYKGGNMVSEDGGETWMDASNRYTGATVEEVAVLPGKPWVVFASGDNATFRSDDGGKTWDGAGLPDVAASSAAIRIFSQGPISPTEILATGGIMDGNVYHSLDEGATWISSTVVLSPTIYAAKAVGVAPSNPQVIYLGYGHGACFRGDWPFCLDGSPGFFRSSNGGYDWDLVASIPFSDTSILDLAVSPDNPQVVFAATMLGPYRSLNGGDDWQFLSDLDADAGGSTSTPSTLVMAVDPFNGQIVYAGSADSGVYKSIDGGDTWDLFSSGMNPNESILELVMDPNLPGLIYAGTRISGVFYSVDGALTWHQLSTNLPGGITVYLGLSADGSVLYGGTGGAGMFVLGSPFDFIYLPMVVNGN